MKQESLRRLFKPAVLNARAYHVPDSTGLVKLDAMENPYPWPEELKQDWLKCLQETSLNRYPDASTHAMHASLRDVFGVPATAGMMFGNGSDELIQIILMALAADANHVMAPEPTFVMYRHLSELLDLVFTGVPLREDFTLDLPAMLTAIKEQQPAVIFLAWPNNPTGNCFDEQQLQAIIEASSGLVVIDEAYHAFAGRSMLPAIGQYPNVLVMRTLSKLGLAGLRLGSLMGPISIIEQLEKIRLPYNIGSLNQASVNFICRHMDVLYGQAEQIMQDRQSLFQSLSAMTRVETWPTEANFILFRVNGFSADNVHARLIDKGILVKNLSAAHPLLKNCLRVTVGSANENRMFLQGLQEIIAAA
ncbi:MAG: histidinol-phosphate transaminase [Gammaproteobacteria bacterium]